MRWKTAQKKAKLQRKVSFAILTLGLILGLILISQVVKVVHTLFSPLNEADERSYHWDSTFNLNLVLLTKPLSLLSYNPTERTVKVIEIPDETYLEVPDGYGSWRVGTIYQLGLVDSPPKGAKLLKDSLGNFFALPVDGFLEVNVKGVSRAKDVVDLLRGNPWSSVAELTNLKTDLTPVELARFNLGLRGVRFDKIYTFNLKDLGLLSDGTLADGTKILVGDPTKIDGLIAKNFTEGKIVNEAATIGVFNTTSKPGLAGKSAELISHLGGNVIIQTSIDENFGKTTVFGDKLYPYTTKRLKQIFDGNCKTEKDCAILGVSTRLASERAAFLDDFSRAQVNLILGQK